MPDYQALYDAASNALGHASLWAAQQIASEMTRPSVLHRPTISQDGDAFIALLGENPQVGVAGCGETPEAAMRDFDRAWFSKATIAKAVA